VHLCPLPNRSTASCGTTDPYSGLAKISTFARSTPTGRYSRAMPTDPNSLLLTTRLRLEPQVAGHADAMLELLADPRIHLYLPSDPPSDPVALKIRYERLESRRSPDERELWLNCFTSAVFRRCTMSGSVVTRFSVRCSPCC
jgi:hypothetical protein